MVAGAPGCPGPFGLGFAIAVPAAKPAIVNPSATDVRNEFIWSEPNDARGAPSRQLAHFHYG